MANLLTFNDFVNTYKILYIPIDNTNNFMKISYGKYLIIMYTFKYKLFNFLLKLCLSLHNCILEMSNYLNLLAVNFKISFSS